MDGYIIFLAELDGTRVHYPRAQRGQFQHLVVTYPVHLMSLRYDPRVGGIDAIDIGINLAHLRSHRRSQGHSRGIRTAATEGGNVAVCIYTLMLLNGTEFQDPEYRRKHGIEGKFRIVPLDFGEYEGQRVIDYEEVGVATNDMSFDDYLYLRGIALLVEALHNGRPFDEFFRLALSLGVSRIDFLRQIYDLRHEQNHNIITNWCIETSDQGVKHRIAKYILVSGTYKEVRDV